MRSPLSICCTRFSNIYLRQVFFQAHTIEFASFPPIPRRVDDNNNLIKLVNKQRWITTNKCSAAHAMRTATIAWSLKRSDRMKANKKIFQIWKSSPYYMDFFIFDILFLAKFILHRPIMSAAIYARAPIVASLFCLSHSQIAHSLHTSKIHFQLPRPSLYGFP